MRRLASSKSWLILLLTVSCFGADRFYGPTSNGSNTGADCNNRFAYNDATNGITSGQANSYVAGNILHLCGVTWIGAAGQQWAATSGKSGTSGNPITIKFETGALLSAPYHAAGGGILVNGGSTWITVDGGTNGIMQNFSDGVSGETCYDGNPCGFQQDSRFVYVSGCTSCNVEVKNLTIKQGWQRNSGDADSNGQGLAGVYFVGTGGVTVDHNSITQVTHCVDGWGNNIVVSFNELFQCNWMYSFGSNTPTSSTLVHDNWIHDWSMWDGSGAFHHDGVFFFPNTGTGNMSGIQEYNNLFGPNSATGNTAMTNWEGTTTNAEYFNNLCILQATQRIPCFSAGNNGGQNPTNPGLLLANNTVIQGCGTGACAGNFGMGPTPAYTGMTITNNVITQGTGLLALSAASDTLSIIDNNVYEDICTDNGACGGIWGYHGSSTNVFATWKGLLPANIGTAGGATEGNSVFNTIANLHIDTSTGVLQTGSPAIGGGANLTSLGIAALNCDKPLVVGVLGTGTCTVRPSSGAWDVGAYQFSSTVTTMGTQVTQGVTITQGVTVK